jgi:hypothetical protein
MNGSSSWRMKTKWRKWLRRKFIEFMERHGWYRRDGFPVFWAGPGTTITVGEHGRLSMRGWLEMVECVVEGDPVPNPERFPGERFGPHFKALITDNMFMGGGIDFGAEVEVFSLSDGRIGPRWPALDSDKVTKA